MSGPPTLEGCDVLPPIEPASGSSRTTIDATASGKSDNKSDNKSDGRPKRKAGDRFAVLNAFVDFTLGELDRGEIAVWMILYRDARDSVAQVSQPNIARRAGMSERGVRKSLAKLLSKELVKIVRQGRIGKGASSYRIHALPPERKRN